jgi:arylsulfatase A-like enzyme
MNTLAVVLLVVAQVHAEWDDVKPSKPNIVFFLADDLGYGDLPMYGNPSIRTPNLDRLAATGLKFYQSYSDSSVCSPSRAALLTGRHAVRSGVYPPSQFPTYTTFFPFTAVGIPSEEVLLPELLKPQGYRSGVFGKWHLGNNGGSLPTQAPGFDSFWGIPYSHDIGVVKNLFLGPNNTCASCAFWASTLKGLGVPLYRNTTIIQQPFDANTFNQNLEVEALQFMRDSAQQPFFLYVAHAMPHVPLIVAPDFVGTQLRGLYGDAIAEMDAFIGRLIDETRSLHIDQKTLFVFTSDNGPWLSQGTFGGTSGPFRGGKGTGWEGGFRMPTVVYQPGRVLPGSTQALVSQLDWFPTFVELAGAQMPSSRQYDGKSMVPLFKWNIFHPPQYDQEFLIRDSIAFYMNGILVAIRHKAFKAHFVTLDTEASQPVIQNPPLLFNVEQDVGEIRPLDVSQPANMQALLDINNVRLALTQTFAVEPPHPPLLANFDFTLVPCCNPPYCSC